MDSSKAASVERWRSQSETVQTQSTLKNSDESVVTSRFLAEFIAYCESKENERREERKARRRLKKLDETIAELEYRISELASRVA